MSVHDGKTVFCCATETDEHGEPVTEEVEYEHENLGTVTHERKVTCDAGPLTFEEYGRFESPPRGERRDQYDRAALVFTCPDCGGETAVCPICSDPDDRSPGGYIDSSSGGAPIPCDNCNQEERAERRRRWGHTGPGPGCRPR